MRLYHFKIILFFLLFPFCLSAQGIDPVLSARLSFVLDSMQTKLGVKSLSAAIEFSDLQHWADASGISSETPLLVYANPEMAYEIGSVTKTMTAACMLQLTQENRIKLDDSLHQWLDTFPFVSPNITIRQLLRHQSGLYDVLANQDCTLALLANRSKIWKPEDLILQFIKAPIAQPGTTWSYCNTNYMLLGMIIEKATGMPFYENFSMRFFQPLQLNSLAIPAFEPISAPVAHVWLDTTGDMQLEDAHHFYMNYLSLNATAGAAGGYFATPSDISKWMRRYMRGELALAELMNQAKMTVTAPGLPGTSYGLGLMKKTFASQIGYGHGGDLGYATSSWYFPSKDLSITVCNNDGSKNSWTLAPVVTALLREYIKWQQTSDLFTPASNGLAARIFPNPFRDHITLEFESPTSFGDIVIVLSDAVGVQVKTMRIHEIAAGNASVRLDVPAHLPEGIYFVEAYSEGKKMGAGRVIRRND